MRATIERNRCWSSLMPSPAVADQCGSGALAVGHVGRQPPEVEEERLALGVKGADQADGFLAEDVGEVHGVVGIVGADRLVVAQQARAALAVEHLLAAQPASQGLLLDLGEVMIEAVLSRARDAASPPSRSP